MTKEIEIPEGCVARIEDNKVIIEPKESEDERIIKAIKGIIVEWFSKATNTFTCEVDEEKLLVYLERQKEQKTVQSDTEKQYVRTLESLISDFLYGKQEVDRDYYQQICNWLEGRHIEQESTEWNAEDEEMLDAMIDMVSNSLYEPLCPKEGMLTWLKSLRPQPHKWYIKKGHWYMCIIDKPEYGWTKGKVYQSPADNRIETDYKGDLTNWPASEPWFRPATREEIPDFKPHWKPNKEQMDALKVSSEYEPCLKNREHLKSLYNDLKKLM